MYKRQAQNRDIGALYDMAAFLNQPNDIEAMCQGFLRRVMLQFDAEGGSIRALDPDNEKLNLVVSVGLSEEPVSYTHLVSEGTLFGRKPQGSEIFIEMPKSRKKATA